MDWLQVAQVVVPIIASVVGGSTVVVKKIAKSRRVMFLTACASVVFHRVEWEKQLVRDSKSVPGWDPAQGDLLDPVIARMRAQMIIAEMLVQAGEHAPNLNETKWLDAYFVNASKAVKLAGPLLKR